VGKVKKTGSAKSQTRQTKGAVSEQKPAASKCSKAPVEADGSVTLDRRSTSDRRKVEERRKVSSMPVAQERRHLERREKVSRRRQIDPTTCERNYSVEEIEFMSALDAYKRTSGRMFPTCSEILEVLQDLGYEKRLVVAPAAPPSIPEEGMPSPVDMTAMPAGVI
jgi:hypothetical protein